MARDAADGYFYEVSAVLLSPAALGILLTFAHPLPSQLYVYIALHVPVIILVLLQVRGSQSLPLHAMCPHICAFCSDSW